MGKTINKVTSMGAQTGSNHTIIRSITLIVGTALRKRIIGVKIFANIGSTAPIIANKTPHINAIAKVKSVRHNVLSTAR